MVVYQLEESLRAAAAAGVMDVQFGVKPPLVQTAWLGGVVRNFKHQAVCQNSGEKI